MAGTSVSAEFDVFSEALTVPSVVLLHTYCVRLQGLVNDLVHVYVCTYVLDVCIRM